VVTNEFGKPLGAACWKGDAMASHGVQSEVMPVGKHRRRRAELINSRRATNCRCSGRSAATVQRAVTVDMEKHPQPSTWLSGYGRGQFSLLWDEIARRLWTSPPRSRAALAGLSARAERYMSRAW
jgi:hypothetical protein